MCWHYVYRTGKGSENDTRNKFDNKFRVQNRSHAGDRGNLRQNNILCLGIDVDINQIGKIGAEAVLKGKFLAGHDELKLQWDI